MVFGRMSGRTKIRSVSTQPIVDKGDRENLDSEVQMAVTHAVTSRSISSDLQAIIDAWPTLSADTRRKLISIVRDTTG